MGAVDVELAERREGEEGGEAELGAEGGVVWDVCVAEDEGDVDGEVLGVVDVELGAGDAVEGELFEVGYGGCDRDDKPLAAVKTERSQLLPPMATKKEWAYQLT